jgi:WD40 repeat protein
MEFSPDGKWVATLEHVKVVRVWEVSTGKELHAVVGPEPGVIRSFAFTPQGDKLVLGAYRGDLVLWDLATDKAVGVLKGHISEALAVAFSADGKYLVSGGFDQTVRRWEWQSPQPVGEVLGKHTNYIHAVAVSADGKRVASSGHDGKVRVWDAVNRKEIFQLDPWKQKMGVTIALRVMLSPDGQVLWAGGHSPIGRWRVDTGELLEVLPGWFGVPALSADGKWLAVGVDRVRLWDVAAGKVVTDFAGHDVLPAVAALSPDGSLAVTAATDRSMHVWDAKSGKLLRTLEGPEGGPTWLLFAPDGRTLFASGRHGAGRALSRWDVATGKQLAPLDDDGTAWRITAALSPDGKTLAVLDHGGGLRAYDLAAGKERFRLRYADDKQLFPGPALVFLAAGDRLAVVTVKDTHKLSLCHYDASDGKKVQEWTRLTYHLSAGSIFLDDVLAPLADGRTLIIAYNNGPLYRLDLHGTEVVALPPALPQILPNRQERRDVRHLSAVLSPDGRLVALIGPDNAIVIREVATGGERMRLTGDQGPLHALAFSADSTRLLSLGADTTALVWELTGARTGPPLPPAQLETLWEELARDDAATAFKALKQLLASPAQAVALVKQRVQPAPVIAPAQLEQWVRDLGDDKYTVRQKAAAELERAGTVAAPSLRKALAEKLPLEAHQRIRKLLASIESSRPPRARLRELRAVELLERIHSPQARQLLGILASGADGDVLTLAARYARTRLTARPQG